MNVLGSYHAMKLLIDYESESDEIFIKDRNWWMDFDLVGDELKMLRIKKFGIWP